MRKNPCIVSIALLALVTLALSGCGADDAPPATTASTAASTTAAGANDSAQAATATLAPPAAAILDASAPLARSAANLGANSFGTATGPAANLAAAASDPIAQNMQANLAADSQQIAPVMRYAPGDSASN